MLDRLTFAFVVQQVQSNKVDIESNSRLDEMVRFAAVSLDHHRNKRLRRMMDLR